MILKILQSRHQAHVMHKVLVQYVPMGVALAQPVENRMQYLDYTTPAPHQPCMEMVRIKVGLWQFINIISCCEVDSQLC